MTEEKKFPTEVIDLPSEGKLYPKDSPLSSGKLEVKYMTAKEEDILTSANLIKKGLAVEKLLDSLIVTENVKIDDLVLGDKNAVMVAARVLAYGPEYTCDITNPNNGEMMNHTFNLADCPFKKLPTDINGNSFSLDLPISKKTIEFKLLTGREEKLIDEELKASSKLIYPGFPFNIWELFVVSPSVLLSLILGNLLPYPIFVISECISKTSEI